MKKNLRIALFTYSTKPRGGVIHTLELAEALQKLGQEVCIYALDKDNIGFHRPVACPSKLVPTKPTLSRQLLLKKQDNYPDRNNKNLILDPVDELIRQRIQEFVTYLDKESETYDIYHSQDCISTNALKVLRDKQRIPNLIRTVHHIDNFNSPYLQECHDRSILEPDICFCVSQYWQQQLQQQYQIDAPIIINGVNTTRFSSKFNGKETKLKEQLGIIGNPVYLTIGGIEPRKNSLKLLQAFTEVLKLYPQAQLIIAGGETLFDYEPYRVEFFKIAEANKINIGKSLILPGVIKDEDMATLYRCADVFVFPSIKEGWGLVLLEAIASKLPVITSNIPPFTEFLTEKSALLVNPNSSHEISQAMVNVLDRNIANKLIKNSKSIVQKYSWEQSAKIHLDLYQKLKTNNQQLTINNQQSTKTMPEINFKIQWPDGVQEDCYSPSLVVKKYFTPGEEYELNDFVEKSRTALNIASDRVKQAYGFPCSRALGQLKQIESKASEYQNLSEPKVLFLYFTE